MNATLTAAQFRDLEKHLSLTPDSIMTADSLTKAIFATTVKRLAETEKLDLDRTVEGYLPKQLNQYPHYTDLAAAAVALFSSDFVPAAFNPVTLNLSVMALSILGWLASQNLPSARRCLREPPKAL